MGYLNRSNRLFAFLITVNGENIHFRDEGRGKEAVAALEKEGLHPLYHQLDIDNEESVIKLRYVAGKTILRLFIQQT